MIKYKVKLRTDYAGRVLYILEIDKKFTMVYKSSGLSGTGHGGEFLPFMFLNSRNTIQCSKGYIFKEMFYNKHFTEHRKQIHKYPEVQEFMKQLESELPYSTTMDDDITLEEIYNICDKFNEEAHNIIQENLIDLKFL